MVFMYVNISFVPWIRHGIAHRFQVSSREKCWDPKQHRCSQYLEGEPCRGVDWICFRGAELCMDEMLSNEMTVLRVSKNRGCLVYPPKWMVKIMENPSEQMDDLGGNTSIFGNTRFWGLFLFIEHGLSQHGFMVLVMSTSHWKPLKQYV